MHCNYYLLWKHISHKIFTESKYFRHIDLKQTMCCYLFGSIPIYTFFHLLLFQRISGNPAYSFRESLASVMENIEFWIALLTNFGQNIFQVIDVFSFTIPSCLGFVMALAISNIKVQFSELPEESNIETKYLFIFDYSDLFIIPVISWWAFVVYICMCLCVRLNT